MRRAVRRRVALHRAVRVVSLPESLGTARITAMSTAPTLVSLLLGVLLSALLCPCWVQSQGPFQFLQQPQMNQSIYGRVASQMASLVAPAVWEQSQQQTQVAAAGSWLLWGTQPDVDITLNYGLNFTTIAGSSTFTYLGNVDFENDFGYAYGGSGCAHRNTFNRFYWMGNTSGSVYNWASADGSTWLQILDPATTVAWTNRTDFSFTGCLVTAQDVVVSLGAADVYQSTNLGVTFSQVLPTGAQYASRQYFGSAIYSPVGGGPDVIVVTAGRGYVTAANPYGSSDYNDVWSSTTLGASWTALTTAAPWSARDSVNFAISGTGVFVLHGGSVYGGSAGWLGDVWVSVNGGSVWAQIAASTNAGQCSQGTLLFDAAGYLYLFFGQYPGYTWVTQAFKSSQTFANIATWGPTANASLSIPATFPLAVNSSSVTFVNSTFQTFAQQVQAQCTASSGLPTATAGAQFTYVQQPNANASVYSRAQSTIAPITVPLTYPVVYQSNGAIDWAVAPTGSWLLWGAQQDVSVSTNQGVTWNLVSGVTYAGLPPPATTDFGYTYGADQCQHRNSFNRFYVIGNGSAGASGQPFFVWASNNGWEWINVIDNATQAAFAGRPNVDFAACMVDMNDRVYSVGGSDVWVSTNLGVTFTARSANRIYSPRTYFGSGIFTNSTASGNRGDIMFVMGGRVPPSAANPYGGNDLNDVWITTSYGYGWTQVSASAPWSARDSLNVAVSNYGVIALYGGSIYGGSSGWLDDTWVSLDGGYLWQQLSGSGQLNNRSQAAILFDSLGYLNVWFGQEAPSYNWSTDGWKSAYSFNNIQQWGPVINPSFSLTTLSPGYSACAPINYQGSATTPTNAGSSSSASPSVSSSTSANNPPVSRASSSSSSPSAAGLSSTGSASSASSSSSSSSSLSGGAIAGIVIGSVVGASLRDSVGSAVFRASVWWRAQEGAQC